MTTNEETLTVGTIRKKGDEVKSMGFVTDQNRLEELRKLGGNALELYQDMIAMNDWHPTKLIGEPILSSDLMHLEFRRLSHGVDSTTAST